MHCQKWCTVTVCIDSVHGMWCAWIMWCALTVCIDSAHELCASCACHIMTRQQQTLQWARRPPNDIHLHVHNTWFWIMHIVNAMRIPAHSYTFMHIIVNAHKSIVHMINMHIHAHCQCTRWHRRLFKCARAVRTDAHNAHLWNSCTQNICTWYTNNSYINDIVLQSMHTKVTLLHRCPTIHAHYLLQSMHII